MPSYPPYSVDPSREAASGPREAMGGSARVRSKAGRFLDRCRRASARMAKRLMAGQCQRAVSWLCILQVLLAGVAPGAEPTRFSEYQVKGAFLVKFAMFVEWPEKTFSDARSPVVIGIMGEDPFGPDYESALSQELANGRAFVVKRFKEPKDLDACQILFICSSESQRLPEILAAVGKRAILTVGDQDRFANRGGMVNFVKDGGKLRFEVNAQAVQTAGLRMSAKLLQVAKPVASEPTKEGH